MRATRANLLSAYAVGLAAALAVGAYRHRDPTRITTRFGAWPDELRHRAPALVRNIDRAVDEVPARIDFVGRNAVVVTFVNPHIWSDGARPRADAPVADTLANHFQTLVTAEVRRTFGPTTTGGVDTVYVTLERRNTLQRLLGRFGKPSSVVTAVYRPVPVIEQRSSAAVSQSGSEVARAGTLPVRPVRAIRPPSCGEFSGGAQWSDRVSAVYVLSIDSVGYWLEAVILARGQPAWDHGDAGPRAPFPPAVPRTRGERAPALSGGTADTFALLYDRANRVAWVGGQRVPLRGANVVLLDHADRLGGEPVVLPPLAVDRRLAQAESLCAIQRMPGASSNRSEVVKSALLRDARIRAFVEQ